MGMPERLHPWTRAEVLALPDDGNRYELIDGELLVTPAPRAIHQRAVAALFRRIDPYVRRHRLGVAGFAPADFDLGTGQYVQPDLYVAALLPDGREPLHWTEYGIPLLIAEVVSPSSARQDRTSKRRRYQRSRVGHYWIVDLDARTIERWEPDDARPEVLEHRIPWHPAPAPEPLVVDVPEYFREVWGEPT